MSAGRIAVRLAYAEPGSQEEDQALAAAVGPLRNCRGPQVVRGAVDRTLLIGQIAEQLYVGRFAMEHVTTPPASEHAAVVEATRRATANWHPVDGLAACVAPIDAAGVDRLMRTAAGSAEEGAALQALQPSLVRCVDAGQQVSLTAPQLRAGLARAFFRLNLKSVPRWAVE